MNAIDLIDSFTEFKELKNIDRVTMMRIVEDVFRTTLKRKYGSDDNVDVIINPDKGDLEIKLPIPVSELFRSLVCLVVTLLINLHRVILLGFS